MRCKLMGIEWEDVFSDACARLLSDVERRQVEH